MSERAGAVAFEGNGLTLLGSELKVGDPLPAFALRAGLAPDSVYTAETDAGKVRMFNIVPSLDTPVCSLQTQRFNQEAGQLGERVIIVTASMDLPPAQNRWCQANSVENLKMASDYFDHSFGLSTGLRIKELGLLARAVVIADAEGIVRYIQVVPEVTDEPDYDDALRALQELL